MIDRRNLIRAFCLLAPGIALLSRPRQADASLPSEPPPSAPVPKAADVNSITFKIDGWDCRATATGDEMLIRINQSWRTAWR